MKAKFVVGLVEGGLRIVLAAMLAVAAVAKVVDRRAFWASLESSGLFGPTTAKAVLVAIPAVELCLAIGLLTAGRERLSGRATLGLSVLFVAYNGLTYYMQGQAVRCACFGTIETPWAEQPIVGSLVLGTLAGLLWASDRYLRKSGARA